MDVELAVTHMHTQPESGLCVVRRQKTLTMYLCVFLYACMHAARPRCVVGGTESSRGRCTGGWLLPYGCRRAGCHHAATVRGRAERGNRNCREICSKGGDFKLRGDCVGLATWAHVFRASPGGRLLGQCLVYMFLWGGSPVEESRCIILRCC